MVYREPKSNFRIYKKTRRDFLLIGGVTLVALGSGCLLDAQRTTTSELPDKELTPTPIKPQVVPTHLQNLEEYCRRTVSIFDEKCPSPTPIEIKPGIPSPQPAIKISPAPNCYELRDGDDYKRQCFIDQGLVKP